jgi:hypothetical protein
MARMPVWLTDDTIAILGLSWNLSLAENLTSLSLQDGPQSGIIISLDPPQQPLFINLNISASTGWIFPKFET